MVTAEDIKKMAELQFFEFTKEETERLVRDLNSDLERLSPIIDAEYESDNVVFEYEPMYLRKDVIIPEVPREEFLSENSKNGYFAVKRRR